MSYITKALFHFPALLMYLQFALYSTVPADNAQRRGCDIWVVFGFSNLVPEISMMKRP